MIITESDSDFFKTSEYFVHLSGSFIIIYRSPTARSRLFVLLSIRNFEQVFVALDKLKLLEVLEQRGSKLLNNSNNFFLKSFPHLFNDKDFFCVHKYKQPCRENFVLSNKTITSYDTHQAV